MKSVNVFVILLSSFALQGFAGISGLVKADSLPPIRFYIAAHSAHIYYRVDRNFNCDGEKPGEVCVCTALIVNRSDGKSD
jgi:hypothetical protein